MCHNSHVSTNPIKCFAMSINHQPVLKILSEKLKYLNYSAKTVSMYTHYVGKFLSQVNKYHQHLAADDFQQYLNGFEFTSVSQQNQVISAIKFFYERVLERKYVKVDFKRPRAERRLPRVIDRDYLLERIAGIKNSKHKAIIALAYSVGLRVSEVINLKIIDIDSARMVISIRQGKGKRDRIVPLSPNVLTLLRNYYKEYKPLDYLFNGQDSPQYSATSCNNIVKQYLGSEYHFHLLRHSCFTSLMEDGTDLRIIQKMAGHRSSQTTEVYTHVSTRVLSRVSLPI